MCECGYEKLGHCGGATQLKAQMAYLDDKKLSSFWTREGALFAVGEYEKLLSQCEDKPELEKSVKDAIEKINSHFKI